MKDVDDNTNDETQEKPAEVEGNSDDDDNLEFGEVIDRLDNQDTGVIDLKDKDDDIGKVGKYGEDI